MRRKDEAVSSPPLEGHIDLHTHSDASDGSFSPGEILDLAEEKGLTAIALTDHDTVSGVPEFLARGAESSSLDVVPGVEISTDLHGREAHIVGLFVDHEHQPLLELLREIRENRDRRNLQIIEKLNRNGFEVTMEEILQVAGGESVGRPHFAKVLIEKGYFSENQEVFDKCLKHGAVAYCKRVLPSPERTIATIHDAGGITIWAHAVYRRANERAFVRKTLKHLTQLGLMGVETLYTTFTDKQCRMMSEFAEEFDLLPSGGTDFHGTNQPKIALGSGFGELRVPRAFYLALLEASEKKA